MHCCCWMHCCCVAHTGTKGLQCPGIRVGWVVASKQNITTLANFSSFGMGGVSHPSQLYAVALLEPSRGTPYSLPFFLVVVLPVLVHRWWSCCCSNGMLVFFFSFFCACFVAVALAKKAVEQHYNFQRERYGAAFAKMGLTVYTGKKQPSSSSSTGGDNNMLQMY
jgi:hypothetical protein